MHWKNFLELTLDNSIRGAQAARARVRPGRRGSSFLPGAHQAQESRVVGTAPGEYLRAGPMHRSLWRTIEWRLVSPLGRELPRPLGDVGCGDGEFGALIFDAADYGIDGDEPSLAHCRDIGTYRETVCADVRSSLGVPEASLASVFSNSTFEHIAPVDGALSAVARALQPGGQFLFTVPAAGLHRAFADAYGSRFSRRLNTMFGHFNLWTSSEWEERLRAAGFSTVTWRGYMTRETAQWFARLHFIRSRRRERREGDAFWDAHQPHFQRLVRESLDACAEADTVCLLIDARR